MRIPYKKQSGQIVLTVALSAIALIAAVGLAVDSGMGYLVKAKLNSAVDSASLAAARAVTQGNTEDAQAASARQSAKEFFDINYPANYLLSTPVLKPVGVTFDKGKVTIDVSATASLPVSLMGVLGFKTLDVNASAQTIRKDLDMVLAMDTSGSLSANATAKAVRAAGVSFLNKFNSTVDRVGLVHFATGAEIDLAISSSSRGFNRTSATAKINAFDFGGGTNSAEGLWQARNQLNNIAQNDRSSLRVMVFFSDGSPAAFSSYFFPTTSGNCKNPGSIATLTDYSSSSTMIYGLHARDQADSTASSTCAATSLTTLPDWYNAHNTVDKANDTTLREFRIVTTLADSPRVVTSSLSGRQNQWTNIHRASRNLAEAIAAKARSENIYIFTLGLGDSLTKGEGPDSEKGEDLLRCLANTVDAPTRCRKPAEPVGLYCYAATESDLSPCFTRLASAILRISK